MIGLDTNVLVRYLTQDDPGQAKVATKAIEDAVDSGEGVYLSGVVLCELVWVLEGAYNLERRKICTLLEQILRTTQFEFQQKDQLWQAWQDYNAGPGDFADYLIGRLARSADAIETLTFDRSLRDSTLFRVL